MGMVDWSELHQDLLGEIAKNIGSVENFVAFSRVCPYWRLAAIKENWVVSCSQFPWLVLAEKEEESCTNNRGFFNLSNGKRYDLDAPQLRGCRLWGSSLGWIVTLDINLDLRLVNPLTQFELSLPHVYTLKHQPGNPNASMAEVQRLIIWLEPEDPREWFKSYFIDKAIVFKRKNQLMVATIYGEEKFLAIARPCDECWTEIETSSSRFFTDILCFNDQLFVIQASGKLSLCEFDEQAIPKLVTVASEIGQFGNNKYLVESMGDLLMVARNLFYYPETSEFSYKTESFDVYKLDFEKKMWVELKNLGDSALFLGDSTTMSLCSTDVVGCESNVIYFTDDNCEQWNIWNKLYGGYDIGVFYLNENVVHTLPNNSLGFEDLNSALCCPFWMMPSLF